MADYDKLSDVLYGVLMGREEAEAGGGESPALGPLSIS